MWEEHKHIELFNLYIPFRKCYFIQKQRTLLSSSAKKIFISLSVLILFFSLSI